MGLILGTAGPGRIYRHAIVFAEPLELRVQNRFITAGFRNRALQVIRNDSFGYAAIIIKGVLAGRDKVFLALTLDSFHIGQQTASQDRHEHLHFAGLFTRRVDPQLAARIVHEQLIPCLMLHTHRRVADAFVATQGDTELRQTVTVRMGCAITLPLLVAGHTLTPHLFAGRRKKSLKGVYTGIGLHRSLLDAEQSVKLGIALGKELLIGKAEGVPLVDILFYRVARSAGHLGDSP